MADAHTTISYAGMRANFWKEKFLRLKSVSARENLLPINVMNTKWSIGKRQKYVKNISWFSLSLTEPSQDHFYQAVLLIKSLKIIISIVMLVDKSAHHKFSFRPVALLKLLPVVLPNSKRSNSRIFNILFCYHFDK